MFLEILIAIFLGILAGTFTGLIPGIHTNLIAATLTTYSILLIAFFSPLTLACFIIAMSVTHSVLSVIPAIFLGAPESAYALGVLPGHRFLLQGKGLFALHLTLIGSLSAICISVILFPVFYLIVLYGYARIEVAIPYIIMLVVALMVWRDQKPLWALVVFILSGIFGLFALHLPTLRNPLFPMLSGLFGIATMLYSITQHSALPAQKSTLGSIPLATNSKAIVAGCASGFITAILPGLGSGMAATIASQMFKNLGDKGFMVLIGSISTFNFILSLAAYATIDKARNGSVIAVRQLMEQITYHEVLIYLLVAALAGCVATMLAKTIGKLFLKLIVRVHYHGLLLVVMLFLVVMTYILSGAIGLAVLVTATAIGLVPAIVKCTRTMGMGCLLVPVLWYFLGV